MKLRTAACGLLVVLLAAVALPDTSLAQTRGLIQVGLNGSTLRGNAASDFSPITRLGGGAGMVMEFGHNLRLRPEVIYIVKGSKVEGYPFDNDVLVEATFDLTYLEIPLLIVYQFQTAGLRPQVFVGPSIAIKIDAQITFRAASGGPSQTEEDATVEDRDLGIMFGAGFETEIGSETILFGVRSSLGFANARQAEPALYNTTVGLFAAIVF